MTTTQRTRLATARRDYHTACRVHRGDPTIENTHAVRRALAALEAARVVALADGVAP